MSSAVATGYSRKEVWLGSAWISHECIIGLLASTKMHVLQGSYIRFAGTETLQACCSRSSSCMHTNPYTHLWACSPCLHPAGVPTCHCRKACEVPTWQQGRAGHAN